MQRIAPSEKDSDDAALEKHLWFFGKNEAGGKCCAVPELDLALVA
ncbi:MAG: hypothetical protein ACOYNN_15070 [Terrimicrobiaceae bacterium]